MQVVVKVLLEEIDNVVTYRRAVLLALVHLLRTELDFGLRLKLRIENLDADGRNDRRADIRRIVILMVKLADRFGDRLTERALVRPALRRMLAVHEREVALAVTGTVRNGHLDILTGKVDRFIKRLFCHVLIQQVEQSVFR